MCKSVLVYDVITRYFMLKIDMGEIELGHFVFISIPLGDAKFVTKEGRRGVGGQPPILSRIVSK